LSLVIVPNRLIKPRPSMLGVTNCYQEHMMTSSSLLWKQ